MVGDPSVAAVAVVVSTVLGSLLGLGLARLRFRGRGATETLLLVPMVTPEIVMGLSLLLFFLQLADAHGSIGQLWVAHITFCVSYVAVVVRARASNMNPQLEEAARDLGASAWGAFRYVTLPLIAPAVLAGALLAFSLSFDDYVVTTFNAGVGSSTLPLYIYGRIKFGITPEINAISTIIVAIVGIALLIAWQLGAFRADGRPRPSESRPADRDLRYHLDHGCDRDAHPRDRRHPPCGGAGRLDRAPARVAGHPRLSRRRARLLAIHPRLCR